MNNTGIARLWQSLLGIWAGTDFGNRLVVLDRAGTAPRIPGIRYRNTPAYDCNPPGWDRTLLQTICDQVGAELFVSTYYTTPLTTPSLFLAYDMIPEFTDFYDMGDAQWQEKHHAIQRASAFAAISQSTARDMEKLYPELCGRITLAYCGVDTGFFTPAPPEEIKAFKKRHGIVKPFYLFIGRRSEYKNGHLLFQAFHCLSDGGDTALVCVGGGNQLEPRYRPLVAGREVHLLDLSDKELRAAYSCALALVYPSKYEGFGLPILEAMACDCPVITCRNSSIPEVAGDAALYVGEDQPEQLAHAMQQVRDPELRRDMSHKGVLRTGEFSWKKMADTMREAMRRAAVDAGGAAAGGGNP